MFTLKTKLVFRRKNGGSGSPADVKPVIECNSPSDDAPSPPKARKLRFFSNLTHLKKMSLASIFKKDPSIQIPLTVSHCAASDSSRHTLAVSEDGFLHPVMPSPTEHRECGPDYGLLSSALHKPSYQEDVNPDPPGSRIASRVTSLRMRTAEVWASIPATVEGLPSSCASSEASTPIKSPIDFLGHDETATVESATVDSPSFSSPATSVTAVSDWGPRVSLANLSMIGHKQEQIRVMPKILPALDVISLAQPPEFPRAKPPSKCRTPDKDKSNYTPNSPASGWELSPALSSSSSEQRASPRAAGLLDSPSPRPRTVAAKQSFHWLPVVQLFADSDKDPTTSSICGSLTLFQRPLATEMPLRPWSCAKIARADTKRASRKRASLLAYLAS